MMDLLTLIFFCAAVVLWTLVLITKINRKDDKE
jgi:preprotein translocase subunit SecG